MTRFLQLSSICVTLLISSNCQEQLPHQNLSCEYGHNCGSAKQVKCSPGYFQQGTEIQATEKCLKCPMNFFNHLWGRQSCFPCGSEAIQPEEGQTTCICLGEGRIFQPSVSRCPCGPGYHPSDEGISCVKTVYDICRDGSSRNHEGSCLTKQEWDDYCPNQVCAHPEDYLGYDKFLGLCICQPVDLDGLCNADCRRKQKHSLKMACIEDNLQITYTDSSGNKKVLMGRGGVGTEGLIVPDRIEEICSLQLKYPHSVYIVRSTEQGFWGLYNPDLSNITNLLDSQYNFSQSNPAEAYRTYRQERTYGILNPTTCIHVNDFIMFIASKHNFPIYDVNNLYNTNPGFDWGSLQTLAEEIHFSSRQQFLFPFQFQEPGVYVMQLSSNHYKKMFIRVMTIGGQCYEEGPFFLAVPRHVIRNGIAQLPPSLIKPDWPAIAGIITGLILVLITCIVILVWFQDLRWPAKTVRIPQFRKLHLKYNLDSYSSKGSAVTAQKKYHPRARIKGHVDKRWDETTKQKSQKFLTGDEFWDYDQQVDLESFDSHAFYDILLKQSFLVTSRLGQLKDEVKVFYEKLVCEVGTLKETFVKRLSIIGHPTRYGNSILEGYIQKKQEVDLEIAKRKRLAAEYEEILNKQLRVLQEDVKSQVEHCVLFNAALRESIRLLEVMRDKTVTSESGNTQYMIKWQKCLAQFDTSCNTMYTAVMKESNRLKLWGVLGEGTGAYLVNKDRTRLLSKRDLIALDGSLLENDIVCFDPILGLITPTAHSIMLLSSHYLMPVPTDYFVHRDTGKALPIVGNIGYDPATSQLISTIDSGYGEMWKTGVPVLPYITYPLDASTGLPVECKLPDIQAQCQNFTLMVDPVPGLEVPILAVTRHPQTQQWLAVGGTYLHPLTNLPSPIEIGGPMIGPRGKIFPILGIGFDRNTGDVIPLGGLLSSSGSVTVLGDVFCDPLSGKKVRIQGAVVQQDRVVPHAGGYQTLLDSNLMMAQIAVIDTLKAHRDLFSEDLPLVKEDFVQAHTAFNEVLETMKKALSMRNQHVISRVYNVTCQLKQAEDIKRYGGNLGMIKYHKTELWIPAVLGTEIPDPGPSDLMVPVLGVEHDYRKGHLIPLAGTMEDSQGQGLVPIKIGARTIDLVTGNSCAVTGVQTNPVTGIVTPVMQPVTPLKDQDSYLLEALQTELNMKETFWQCQRNKEEELMKDLYSCIIHVLDVAREGKTHKIRLKDRIFSLDESCQSLEDSSLSEVQRRTSPNLSSLVVKMSQLPFLEDSTEEKEQQLIFSLVFKKTTEKLMEFINRIEQESERHCSQLTEWMKSREQSNEDIVKTKQAAIMQHYIDEFEDHIMRRLSGVDAAYCRLEYVREQTKQQGLMAKSYLLGTSLHYVNSQKSYWNVTRREQRHIGQMLIPMLKHLTQTMEENVKSTPPIEAPASGYSSRSTLKASAANSDKLQVSSATNKPKHSIRAPWLCTTEIFQKHQGYVFRFLLEKQASELVHLERILLTEEMNRIWTFYESYKVKTNPWVVTPQNKDKQPLKTDPEINMNLEWDTLVEELTKVHSFALKALHEKHQEEVKSWGLNPDTIVPGNYFKRDVKAAILHLAMEILTAYQQQPCDNSQGMSSAEAALFTNTKDSQSLFLWNIAAKFVRQELLIQIHTYNILDTYLEIQIGNCVEEVQKILSTSQWKSYGGKPAAEDAADLLEKQYLDRLISLLKKTSCNEKQSQLPLDEVQHQLKEDHCALTEKMVQDKYTSLLQAMANSSVTPYNTEYVVCFVLSQRHFRQSVMLLQDIFKVRKEEQEKLLKKLSLHDDINTMHFQEDLLNLFDNKTEARFLVADLQHVIKRIQLRACHVKELASGIKEYCSNKANILGYMEEAQCLEYELQTFTEQELKTLKEKLKELSESTMLSDHQCIGRTSEQNGDITLNDTDSFRYSQDKEVEVEQSHRKQIAEERMKLQDQLERGELSGLMKQKLIREHDETIGFLEKALQHNLDMLNIKLETDLMLKKKLEDTTQTDLDPPHGKSNLQSNDQKILSLLIENISVFQQAEQIAAARISNLGPQLYSSLYPTDTISSKPLESSPLLSLLKEVDSQLRTSAQSAKLLGDCKGPEQRGPFRDIQDLQLHCRGDLSPVLPEDLSAWEYVIYQYGIHILQLLKSHIDIGDLHLHISSSLPSGNDDKNAFSNSFFYQRSENNLFVSREYLQSVGSFTLLLVHCTSHIISDGFCDDFNPLFLRTFYQAIKVCFAEGFFTKYELSRHSQLNNPCSAQCRSLPKTYNWSKDNIDFIPQLISIKFHPAGKNSSHGEAVKTGERLPLSELELTLKEKLAKRKKEFFANNLIDETCTAIKEESNQEWISTEHLLEALDQMNSELIKILEKEVVLQNLQDLEGRCYHLKALCLERQHLIRNIEKLEEQITLHSNLV